MAADTYLRDDDSDPNRQQADLVPNVLPRMSNKIEGLDIPSVMDQKQTCEFLGISRWLFFELVRRDELPGVFRVGRLVRVHTATLVAGLVERPRVQNG
jgi:hypothetical protein